MTTTSETGQFGDTTWWVDEDGGRARIDRRTGWPHYLVTCRGVTRLIAGDDFGRAHDAALAAIRATRGEAQPEPQHATGEWWQVDNDRWSSKAGEWEFAVLRVDAERGEDGALHGGRWAWDALCSTSGVEHEGECATRDEAMAAAEAAAQREDVTTQRLHRLLAESREPEWIARAAEQPDPLAVSGAAGVAPRTEQPTTTEWRQIDGWYWMREVGGLRVEVRRSSRDVWWTVTALLSRCGHRDVCVVRQESPGGDVGGAREDADYWLRVRGVL